MNITFLGAARAVTGSCFLVETANARFLVDCGMHQGRAEETRSNAAPFPFAMDSIDFVLLTHAHIDHSGRIPKLWLDGYRNPVYATKATADLCGIMLPDSGHIQEMDAEWENRKRKRAGKAFEQPLYTYQDALESLKLFRRRKYDETFSPAPGVRIAFRDAGHILGSSITEIWAEENGRETKAVFSGDLGYKGKPILRDPAVIDGADILVVESTYGDRLHENAGDRTKRLLDIINETARRGGNVVIPAFAVGRTQELVYELNKSMEGEAHRGEPFASLPVYVDSPLAVSATQIFRENMDCFDEEARRIIDSGNNPLDFRNLHFVATMEESKRLNEDRQSKIILSASGMCDAGRIKHHLKHNLWRRESTILFVGYQAEGTLGRRLADGAKRVKLFGEEIRVNAHIEKIEGFSGHADREGLLTWISEFKRKPGMIALVHGENGALSSLAQAIEERFGIRPSIPGPGESVQAGKAVAAAPAAASADARKLAAYGMLDELQEDFSSQMAAMKEEIVHASSAEETAKVSAKIGQLLKRMRELAG